MHRLPKWRGTAGSASNPRTKEYVYHIAFCAKGEAECRAYNERETSDEELEISHICGNAYCVNPDHLELVPAWLNKLRAKCHATGMLIGPDGEACSTCECNPPCIFTVPAKVVAPIRYEVNAKLMGW